MIFQPAALRRAGLRTSDVCKLVGLQGLSTVFESFGIAMLVPILQLMQAEGSVDGLIEEYGYWRVLADGLDSVGLPVTLATVGVLALAAFLGRQGVLYVNQVIGGRIRYRLIRDMRTRGFDAVLHTSLDYADGTSKETVINTLTMEIERAVTSMMSTVEIIAITLMMLIYFGILAGISAPLLAMVVASAAVVSVPLSYLMRQAHATGQRIVRNNEAVTSHVVERLNQFRLIRLSGMERAETDAMADYAHHQCVANVRAVELQARLLAVAEPAILIMGFGFLIAGDMVFGLPAEAAGLFFVILLRLAPIFRNLMRARQTCLMNAPSLERYLERSDAFAAHTETAREGPARRRLGPLRHGVRFDGVGYRYPGATVPSVDGIDLDIAAGSMVALVGPSGAGKSTLIDMVPLLRHPTMGRILYDGEPTDRLPLASLRAQISYAPQVPQLFNVPIASHIRYGHPGASDAEVVAAARLAAADDFISRLPEGYDTLLGSAGIRLSGGQRQRIDLARALLKSASILIVDEPTSALDAESERLIAEALYRARDELWRTVIIVGHRLALVSGADQIVVLRDGKVAETGTHRSLIAAGGWYARASETQDRTAHRDAVGIP